LELDQRTNPIFKTAVKHPSLNHSKNLPVSTEGVPRSRKKKEIENIAKKANNIIHGRLLTLQATLNLSQPN
jgi:hypothetical protein